VGCPTRRVCVWVFWSRFSQNQSADRIDCDQPVLSLRIERPTAPRPILRMFCLQLSHRFRLVQTREI
jgi:hypothetical protein